MRWHVIFSEIVFVLNLHPPARPKYNQDEIIAAYKRLIRQMPPPNQYLLLYVLDLLSVFARKSEKNLMTAPSMLFTHLGIDMSNWINRSCSDFSTRPHLAS